MQTDNLIPLGDEEIIELLLNNTADVDHKDINGENALHAAAQSGLEESISMDISNNQT